MPAPLGNKFGTKLKDPEIRQKAYQQYCEHIAKGWPKQSFVFQGEDCLCTWETIEKYIKNNPDEFEPILMQVAKAKKLQHWFEEGVNLVRGLYKKGSPVVWQTIMRNSFKDIGWDQDKFEDRFADHREQFKEFMGLLVGKQKENTPNPQHSGSSDESASVSSSSHALNCSMNVSDIARTNPS